MAKQAKRTTDLPGFADKRAAKKAVASADKDAQFRIAAIGKKAFSTMTRPEKDELLFLLCLRAGILPKETE